MQDFRLPPCLQIPTNVRQTEHDDRRFVVLRFCAVDQALQASRAPSLWSRVYHRLANKPVDESFTVRFFLPHGQIESFVNDVAHQVAQPVRDATFGMVAAARALDLVARGSARTPVPAGL